VNGSRQYPCNHKISIAWFICHSDKNWDNTKKNYFPSDMRIGTIRSFHYKMWVLRWIK
jgi:hypothetical protein